MLLCAPGLALAAGAQPALAFTPPPQGYRLQLDKLDGYSFFYPEGWLAFSSSGNDVFLRNPRVIDECLFMDFSSMSSSRYTSVKDLGSAEEAAARILDQYLTREFMSTRLGIRRDGKVRRGFLFGFFWIFFVILLGFWGVFWFSTQHTAHSTQHMVEHSFSTTSLAAELLAGGEREARGC